MAEIQRMTPTHDAMLDWMLVNPGATLREMGAHFGYSVAWLSQVINSDLFQARYRDRRGEIDSYVAADIPAKMRAAAALAVEKLTQHIERSENPDFILESSDKLLHRLGYAPSKGPASGPTSVTNNIQNNVMITNSSALALAREKMVQLGQTITVPVPVPPILPAPLDCPDALICQPSDT